MKYIVTKDEDGKEDIFLFPKSIDHDVMAETLEGMRSATHGEWVREFRTPVSAGFIENGACIGGSETLGLSSRVGDTDLLKRTLKVSKVDEKSNLDKFFWISWHQPTKDYRPLTSPPNEKVLGLWCTGVRCKDGASTLVAMVKSSNESAAKCSILKDWPEAIDWRFCDEKSLKSLSDRFPLNAWMEKRFKAF